MKNLAIIPARSGSKGLPDKNIKLLGGKPLFAYSIKAANESGLFEEILVSTDSQEYAKIAKEWGAAVPFLRSARTSTDQASSWDAVKEAVENYRGLGREFDTITLLQPTSPLRTAQDIREGYRMMEEKEARAVVSVCEMDHSPLWSNTLPEDHSMADFIREEVKNRPRQELPSYYRINGALYILRTKVLEDIGGLYGPGCYAYVMPGERSVDIDTSLDFKIAESLLLG
ncbi:MAG: acylneuraminate cytidylyltransferase family protein [Lachnospiraceae bacterium]|nr:acylneuraminate cytidylyltransferase family protein [Lachnospiraceae bacterium]